MRNFESVRFGKIMCPETVDELLKIAFEPERPDGANVWMWRGQSDIAWGLDSSAFRRLKLTKKLPCEDDLVHYETSLISGARYRGFDRHKGRALSDLEVLARLQHHGAATRLLDATRSVLVALYFSACQRIEKTGVLIGFHTHYLGGYEAEAEDRPYSEIVKDIAPMSYAHTWQPTDISARVAAQHSQFIYSSVGTQKHGSVKIDTDTDSYKAVAVSPEMKKSIMRVLRDTFDIHFATLFPDLDGFCQSNSVNFPQYFNHRW